MTWLGVTFAGPWAASLPAAGPTAAQKNDAQIRGIMNLFLPFPAFVTTGTASSPSPTRHERWAKAFAFQDSRNNMPPGTCAAKMPGKARVILAAPGPPPLIRACAHFVLEDLDACEAMVLKVTQNDKAPVIERSMAWGIAGNVSLENGKLDQAQSRFEKAASLADPTHSFNLWVDSQQGLYRVAQMKGDRKQQLNMLQSLHQQSTLSQGRTSGATLGYQNRVANELYVQGRYAEAEKEYLDLIKSLDERPNKDVMQVQVLRDNLAKTIAAQGRKEESENLSLKLVKPPLSTENETASSLEKRGALGIHYFGEKKFAEAAEQFRIVEDAMRQRKGLEAPETLIAQNNLAAALQALGKNEEAAELLVGVIAVHEKNLPADDLKIMENRNNLGNALHGMGAHEEAAIQHRRVAEVRRRKLGPRNVKTLDALVNLTSDLQSLKQFDEALSLAREVLAGRKSVNGLKDPKTLASWEGLAAILDTAGKREESEKECRALALYSEKEFGPTALSTISAYHLLANTLFNRGNVEESRKWCLKALEGYRKKVGPHNRHTIQCEELMSKIALTPVGRRGVGTGIATIAARSVLAKQLDAFGPTHPATLKARTALAHHLLTENRLADAAKEYEITISAYKNQSLMQTEDAIDARSGQAELMRCLGRLNESEALFRALLDDCVTSLPEEHIFRSACLGNFAILLKAQGKYEEALKLQKEVLIRDAAQLEEMHPWAVKNYVQIADTLRELGRKDEWRIYLQKAYDISKRTLGDAHIQTQTFNTLLTDPSAFDRLSGPADSTSAPSVSPAPAQRSIFGPPPGTPDIPSQPMRNSSFDELKKGWDNL